MWRSVGTLIGEDSPYLQTITSSCHHCVDPACASGCPVLAYEKDPVTGIVRHLDDQCIGCQYCVLKCPYDVPKYSKAKGIVRKCDMCQSRLAVGEAPACAQACPHEAIRIEIVSHNDIRATGLIPDARIVPGAFSSSYTLPTTRYESTKTSPARIRSACTDSLRLERPHWPLILMLILTQIAAGLHLVLLLSLPGTLGKEFSATAALVLFGGLAASIFHLGRPLKAWRAFLGWRRSWMSREILAFSVYAPFTTLLLFSPANRLLIAATALIAMLSVFLSAMVYVDTQRPGWAAKTVFPAFFGTAFLLGPTVAGALCGWLSPAWAPILTSAATVVRTSLFSWRWTALAGGNAAVFRLAHGKFAWMILLFAISTVFSLLAIFNAAQLGAYWGTIACLSTIAAQILDRWLFFVGTPAPRMPGAFSP